MKAAFLIYFFGSVIAWIGLGFIGKDISLTALWLAVLPLMYLIGFKSGYAAWPRGEARLALFLVFLLFIWSLFSWTMGITRFGFEGNWVLSLAVPLGIFSLAAWSLLFDNSDTAIRSMVITWESLLVVDAAITVGQFVATFMGWLDPIVFFENPRYTVIYKPMLGEAVVRSPGVFESGATNGAFLGVGAIWFLVNHRYRVIGSRSGDLTKSILLFVAVIITFTRRDLVGLFAVFAVWAVMEVMRRRLMMLGVGSIASIIFGSYLAYHYRSVFDSYFSDSSLFDRFGHWNAALDMLDASPSALVFGFGVIQSALTQDGVLSVSKYADIAVLDQMYLSWLVYGGLVFLLLMCALFALVACAGLRLFLRARSDALIGGGAFIFLAVVFFAVVGAFGTFWANLPESLSMWVLVLSFLSWLCSRKSGVANA